MYASLRFEAREKESFQFEKHGLCVRKCFGAIVGVRQWSWFLGNRNNDRSDVSNRIGDIFPLVQLLDQIICDLIEGMVKKGGIIGAGVVENVMFNTLVSADEAAGIVAIFVGVVVLVTSITSTTATSTTIVVPVSGGISLLIALDVGLDVVPHYFAMN